MNNEKLRINNNHNTFVIPAKAGIQRKKEEQRTTKNNE
jgi:hypothetical protein